jgi:hypothetical protein
MNLNFYYLCKKFYSILKQFFDHMIIAYSHFGTISVNVSSLAPICEFFCVAKRSSLLRQVAMYATHSFVALFPFSRGSIALSTNGS